MSKFKYSSPHVFAFELKFIFIYASPYVDNFGGWVSGNTTDFVVAVIELGTFARRFWIAGVPGSTALDQARCDATSMLCLRHTFACPHGSGSKTLVIVEINTTVLIVIIIVLFFILTLKMTINNEANVMNNVITQS